MALKVVALVGCPNVGKSTLFNRLTRSRDALVADLPGLTRDRRYGRAQFDGRPYIVIDTGGITDERGQTSDLTGRMTSQALQAVAECDLVLFLVDARAGLTAGDLHVAGHIRRAGKPCAVVANKTDGLDPELAEGEFYELGLGEVYAVAAAHGRGVSVLVEEVIAPLLEEDDAEAAAPPPAEEGGWEGGFDFLDNVPTARRGPARLPPRRRPLPAAADAAAAADASADAPDDAAAEAAADAAAEVLGTESGSEAGGEDAGEDGREGGAAAGAAYAAAMTPARAGEQGVAAAGGDLEAPALAGEQAVPAAGGDQDAMAGEAAAAPFADLPVKFAIVGKPNVGKSTLTNRLLGEQRVVVADLPGTTRDAVYIPLEREGRRYIIIDTAGVRRRGKVSAAVEKFSIVRTLRAIEDCNVALLLLDGREMLSDQDLSLLGFIIDAGRALVIAVNKWDGLEQEQRERLRRALEQRLGFADFARIHFISALHGSGVGHLFASLDEAYAAATTRHGAALLNRLLRQAVEEHQPPLSGGRRIRLKYAHPGGYNPPRIIIHGNKVSRLPESYRRYLSNYFRRALHLVGTPICMEFREGDNPYAAAAAAQRRPTQSQQRARQRHEQEQRHYRSNARRAAAAAGRRRGGGQRGPAGGTEP